MIFLFSKYDLRLQILKESSFINLTKSSSLQTTPTIARVLYLFLCEGQAEIDAYINSFPSITADVMFFCWKENCFDQKFSNKPPSIYVSKWSGQSSRNQPFVHIHSTFNSILVYPRVFIINEQKLNLTRRSTWTTARNMLYERALLEEHRQGWRWAYFTFGDGDVKLSCPLSEKLLKTNQSNGDEVIIAEHFRSLISIQKSFANVTINKQCYIFFDTFLLTVSPAIGGTAYTLLPPVFNGLLTQIVYHVDAMFNAFHHDALSFILPYCPRYDTRTWWTSQAILVYRSLCLYGHNIQLNAIHIDQEKHRGYPRGGDPWVIDSDMNLVPSYLIPLQNYMKTGRVVSPLVLQNYGGWSLNLTSDECRQNYIYVDPTNCKVSGIRNQSLLR